MQESNGDQPADEEAKVEVNDPVACGEFVSRDGWKDILRDNFTIMAISGAFELNSTGLKEDNLDGPKLKLKTKLEKVIAIADSGNPRSF